MKKSNFIVYLILPACLLLTLSACEKEWLDEKSDKNMVVPETLKDFQALLDDPYVVNRFYSSISKAVTDNYYVPDDDLANLRESTRNLYSWDQEINWDNGSSYDWNSPFTVIEHANIVLEGLDKIDPSQPGWADLKGQACFYRAFAYFNLSQVFCRTYDKNTSDSDLGLPIRMTSDVNVSVQRSTLEELYTRIISDANNAVEFLTTTPKYLQRPSKAAANALLARIPLLMGNYEKAEHYASEVLKTNNELIDFNNPEQVSHSYTYKFPAQGLGNPEILFYAFSDDNPFSLNYMGNYVQADPDLYNSYEENDLRKEYFFGTDEDIIKFVGTYTGFGFGFGGLGVNETLLIRAECRARLGRIDEALEDINALLIKRYKTGFFIPIEITEPDAALDKILLERRKELANTGNVRWEDLKRLNKNTRFQVTLKRKINGSEVIIPPNDPRYIFPIPENEILSSGIIQNQRN